MEASEVKQLRLHQEFTYAVKACDCSSASAIAQAINSNERSILAHHVAQVNSRSCFPPLSAAQFITLLDQLFSAGLPCLTPEQIELAEYLVLEFCDVALCCEPTSFNKGKPTQNRRDRVSVLDSFYNHPLYPFEHFDDKRVWDLCLQRHMENERRTPFRNMFFPDMDLVRWLILHGARETSSRGQGRNIKARLASLDEQGVIGSFGHPSLSDKFFEAQDEWERVRRGAEQQLSLEIDKASSLQSSLISFIVAYASISSPFQLAFPSRKQYCAVM